MEQKMITRILSVVIMLMCISRVVLAGDLQKEFASPPAESRAWSYWWWLNGNVTKEAITRDLEAMKEKGFGGALIMDAGGADQKGNRQVPHGPDFAGPEWRKLFRHTLREAKRLDLELALNIQSGWNLGGPSVTTAEAAKILCWSETPVSGPGLIVTNLAAPTSRQGLLGEVAVLAVPDGKDTIVNWDVKALYRSLHFSAPDTSLLLEPPPAGKDASVLSPEQVINVSGLVDGDGRLTWNAPAGNWRIYRFCYTLGPRTHVSTYSQNCGGLALDPMDAAAFQRYWDTVVEPLMKDAADVEGNTLRYLHTDSWEVEPYNWTAQFPAAFRKRCGYDLLSWLPILARRKVGGTDATDRFLHDFRKTVAALSAESYYGTFLKNAHRHGLQVRAESGGPHAVPIDAQHCLGMIDVPMSEFWASSWLHRVKDEERFFVKQPAMAAHTYGKKIVAAEGFTTIGPHWQERVWNNLKPAFDRALCEGLNQLVWTLVTCSPAEAGMPGQEMFPGTHFNPNSTWWSQSEGFLSYINRCQWMLRQGHFVADVLYYYGDHAPNFAQLKQSNPAKLPPGYDYDVATEYVLLNRVDVKDGRIVLPDGMNYGALVLAPHRTVSLAVLRKLKALAEAGATIIGTPAESSSGLTAWQTGDTEAREIIAKLWSKSDSGKALVRHANTAAWLNAINLPPDFSVSETTGNIDFIHRRDGEREIYFVANRDNHPVQGQMCFRTNRKTPSWWEPLDGSRRPLPTYRMTDDGRTEIDVRLEACGSGFIVFEPGGVEQSVSSAKAPGKTNFPVFKPVGVLLGPWDVAFDPAWMYPDNGTGGKFVFEQLTDWTQRPENGIRYFSGTAVYRKTFPSPPAAAEKGKELFLSLGDVREMARVRINGRDLGVVWCPPWRIPVPADVLKTMDNQLEIEVVNFWPNRLIGDAKLPAPERRTRTNITKFDQPKGDTNYTTLMPSGLFGPVTLQQVVAE
jgi:alpha-L-rhamnosidase